MTNFATKIVSVWPPLRKRFIPTFRFFVRKVGSFKKVGNMTQEEFIQRCVDKYGDNFDYSMIVYTNPLCRIKVKCNNCGSVFEVRANHFLYDKSSGCCPYCRYEKLRKRFAFSKDDFLKKAKATHGIFYSYDKTVYRNMHTKIIVTCPIHGDFYIVPQHHINGGGCPLCMVQENVDYNSFLEEERKIEKTSNRAARIALIKEQRRKLNELRFLSKAKELHKNMGYDYSIVKYVNAKTAVEIVCPVHGSFWQKPTVHLQGCGCPFCKRSLGEEAVAFCLDKYSIEYQKQYKIKNDILFSNKHFYVDFYLPKYNTIIEYNGSQHYRITGYFGGKKKLEDTQERDLTLRQYCKQHGIKLIEIPYWDYDNIETILKKELKIK